MEGTIVYALELVIPYEGASLIGVFTSLEKLTNHARELNGGVLPYMNTPDSYYDWYPVVLDSPEQFKSFTEIY